MSWLLTFALIVALAWAAAWTDELRASRRTPPPRSSSPGVPKFPHQKRSSP